MAELKSEIEERENLLVLLGQTVTVLERVCRKPSPFSEIVSESLLNETKVTQALEFLEDHLLIKRKHKSTNGGTKMFYYSSPKETFQSLLRKLCEQWQPKEIKAKLKMKASSVEFVTEEAGERFIKSFENNK